MESNFEKIRFQIEEFCAQKLNGNMEPLEGLQKLQTQKSDMIDNTLRPELISAALIYSYLRAHNLNGKNGITIKELAGYFDAKPQAITQKVFDVDCHINPKAIFPEKYSPYEFVDKDRFKVSSDYCDFLESKEADDFKKSEKILLSLIKKDPDFFDPYTSLHEYYLKKRDFKKAYELMAKGYERAMNLILQKSRFPDSLPWGFVENRHIIRVLFNFAALLWASDKKREAIDIFSNLLRSNPMDNIGARYAIVGVLEGFVSLWELEQKFELESGFIDWEKQEMWFSACAKKYPNEIGWWLEYSSKPKE